LVTTDPLIRPGDSGVEVVLLVDLFEEIPVWDKGGVGVW
jgi:hypothetical protein